MYSVLFILPTDLRMSSVRQITDSTAPKNFDLQNIKMQDKLLASSNEGAILFHQLSQKYLDNACEVIRKTIFTSGNISRTIGLPDDPEAQKELDQVSKIAARDGVTIIAIDQNTDKVVGAAFNKILVRSEKFYESFREIFKKEKSRKIVEFIVETDNICNLFEHCQVECVMEHLFLGVLPEYRKKGIAKKLTELSLELAQKLYNGVNVKKSLDGEEMSLEPVPEIICAIFTSFISQRIGEQLGFEVVAERSNKDIESAGEVTIDTDKTTVAYKRLIKE